MNQAICIFEDKNYLNFRPLVYFRPVYDILSGTSLLRNKIENYFNESDFIYHCRKYIAESFQKNSKTEYVNSMPDKIESILFINGRIIADNKIQRLHDIENNSFIIKNEEILAAKLSGQLLENINFNSENLFENFDFAELNMSKLEINFKTVDYIWDLININNDQIKTDYKNFYKSQEVQKSFDGVYLVKSSNIFIDENVSINPCTVVDASGGPVIISKNVKIESHCSIKGPIFIGENTIVKTGSNIYAGTSIGNTCKVCGEIEGTIINDYSNKQHDGFLGHSYLGSWINLGAGTTTSDLKNNYSKVSVEFFENKINTEMQFLGLLMGDHSKTAVNTTFNTGTIIGTCCNLFGNLFDQKLYHSFFWGGSEKPDVTKLDKAKEIAEIVMNRRNIEFSSNDKKLFNDVFDLTSKERNS